MTPGHGDDDCGRRCKLECMVTTPVLILCGHMLVSPSTVGRFGGLLRVVGDFTLPHHFGFHLIGGFALCKWDGVQALVNK